MIRAVPAQKFALDKMILVLSVTPVATLSTATTVSSVLHTPSLHVGVEPGHVGQEIPWYESAVNGRSIAFSIKLYEALRCTYPAYCNNEPNVDIMNMHVTAQITLICTCTVSAVHRLDQPVLLQVRTVPLATSDNHHENVPLWVVRRSQCITLMQDCLSSS